MIEITKKLPSETTERIWAWLENHIGPHLTEDVSSYARGRKRAWLNIEPTLTNPVRELPAVYVPEAYMKALAERIEWEFDYCLVTFSGVLDAKGIAPHRDASYADYEAYGLNVSGTCLFNYWNGRPSFGEAVEKVVYNPKVHKPTHRFMLEPGEILRFNCKNLHSAEPSPARWNMNFWRRKK